MIFKTFDSDKNTFSSKFGILGKSFEDIGNRFKKVSDELIVTNDYTISNIANAWKKSSIKKDLSDKFIITKSDIQDKLKDLSVYEQNPDDILNGLLTQKKLVDANQSSWQDYFNGLKEESLFLVIGLAFLLEDFFDLDLLFNLSANKLFSEISS